MGCIGSGLWSQHSAPRVVRKEHAVILRLEDVVEGKSVLTALAEGRRLEPCTRFAPPSPIAKDEPPPTHMGVSEIRVPYWDPEKSGILLFGGLF